MSILALQAARRRTVPAARNPLDRSTIVSIYNKAITEIKETIQPRTFSIDAGTFENPAILVVGSASWWREIDAEQPLLEIPNSSIQVADSFVKDYCNGILACSTGVAQPGLFFIPGEFNIKQIKNNHSELLLRAKVRQDAWYEALIKLADGLWARTNGNPLTISDDMRNAAKELGRNDKDWMKDFTMINQVKCAACGSPRNPEFPVCPTCKAVVDVTKATALGIKFAL